MDLSSNQFKNYLFGAGNNFPVAIIRLLIQVLGIKNDMKKSRPGRIKISDLDLESASIESYSSGHIDAFLKEGRCQAVFEALQIRGHKTVESIGH